MKKINIGLILTILVLLILVVYNVNLEIERKSDKASIQDICEKYIDFDTKYSMLEENKRTIPRTISDEEYSRYLEEAKSELGKLFVQDDMFINNQYGVLKQNLDNQTINLTYVITSLKREIVEVKKFEFSGNQVKVSISTNIEIKYMEKDSSNNQTKENERTSQYNDTITLKKINGEWKVAYANLQNLILLYKYGSNYSAYMM